MKPIPASFKPLLAKLRELRAELRELEATPPPCDPLDAFRQVFRDGLEDEPNLP